MGRRAKAPPSSEASGIHNHRCEGVDNDFHTRESDGEEEIVDTVQGRTEVIDLSTEDDVEEPVEEEPGTVLVESKPESPIVNSSGSEDSDSEGTVDTSVLEEGVPVLCKVNGTELLGEVVIRDSTAEERVGDIVDHNLEEFNRQPGDNRTSIQEVCRDVEVPYGSLKVEFGSRGSSCTQKVLIKQSKSGEGFTVDAYWNTIEGAPRAVDHYCRIVRYPAEGVVSLYNLIFKDLGASIGEEPEPEDSADTTEGVKEPEPKKFKTDKEEST
jgi:hypothetical protein